MNSDLLKNPVFSSIVAMVIVFAIIFLILWLVKPGFVTKNVQGKKVIQWKRVVTYSALSGLVIGVVVLLWMADSKKKKQLQTFSTAPNRFQKYWYPKSYPKAYSKSYRKA